MKKVNDLKLKDEVLYCSNFSNPKCIKTYVGTITKFYRAGVTKHIMAVCKYTNHFGEDFINEFNVQKLRKI